MQLRRRGSFRRGPLRSPWLATTVAQETRSSRFASTPALTTLPFTSTWRRCGGTRWPAGAWQAFLSFFKRPQPLLLFARCCVWERLSSRLRDRVVMTMVVFILNHAALAWCAMVAVLGKATVAFNVVLLQFLALSDANALNFTWPVFAPTASSTATLARHSSNYVLLV